MIKQNGYGICSKCPVCKSSKIDAYDYEGDNYVFNYKVRCLDCDSTWFEEYKEPCWDLEYNGKTGQEL